MTHWWVPLRSFSALSDKKFWQKIVIFPPPSYPYLFSRPESFRSTDQKGFSTKFFGTVRQNFRQKSWHNSLKPKIFRYPKLMTHWWVPLRRFSVLWDNIFDTKSWHNSLKPKIFRNPKLMTHWWVPLRSFLALSDKKFWQEIVIFPPPSYPYLFSRPEIFRSTDQKGFSTKIFGTVRQNFRHKNVT